jgi:hypothetical protein
MNKKSSRDCVMCSGGWSTRYTRMPSVCSRKLERSVCDLCCLDELETATNHRRLFPKRVRGVLYEA